MAPHMARFRIPNEGPGWEGRPVLASELEPERGLRNECLFLSHSLDAAPLAWRWRCICICMHTFQARTLKLANRVPELTLL